MALMALPSTTAVQVGEGGFNVYAKPPSTSIFDVLDPRRVAATIVCLHDKNPTSSMQRCRVTAILPHEQNPTASEDDRRMLKNVEKLSRADVQFPKVRFELPPMQLRGKPTKWSGLGVPAQKSGEENAAADISSWQHKFWLSVKLDNLPDDFLLPIIKGKIPAHMRKDPATGQDLDLSKMQPQELRSFLVQMNLRAIDLLRYVTIELERKRFFHPEYMTAQQCQEVIQSFRKMLRQPELPEVDALNMKFEQNVQEHKVLSIFGNLPVDDRMEAKIGKGISVGNRAWYRPKTPPTKQENEEVAIEYMNKSARPKPLGFPPNDKFRDALSKGLRQRRVPVFGKNSQKKMVMELPQPDDPFDFPARPGDIVTATLVIDMYDAKSTGSSIHVEEFRILFQAPPSQQRQYALEEELEDLPDFVQPYAFVAEEEKSKDVGRQEGGQENSGMDYSSTSSPPTYKDSKFHNPPELESEPLWKRRAVSTSSNDFHGATSQQNENYGPPYGVPFFPGMKQNGSFGNMQNPGIQNPAIQNQGIQNPGMQNPGIHSMQNQVGGIMQQLPTNVGTHIASYLGTMHNGSIGNQGGGTMHNGSIGNQGGATMHNGTMHNGSIGNQGLGTHNSSTSSQQLQNTGFGMAGFGPPTSQPASQGFQLSRD